MERFGDRCFFHQISTFWLYDILKAQDTILKAQDAHLEGWTPILKVLYDLNADLKSSFEGLKLRFTSFRSGLPFSKVHFKGRTHFEDGWFLGTLDVDLGTGIPIEKSAIVFSLDFGFRMKVSDGLFLNS
uniref:Uncharacterized protein n=1 Tax=Rhizophagus irregularis (strain DAOM 181602 / DAOM 197198 / MUCL 43194) TaxID=747089 RepID=U9V7F7_RHIID